MKYGLYRGWLALLISGWIALTVGCTPASHEPDLAVAIPDLSERADSVQKVIGESVSQLKDAAKGEDPGALAKAYGQTGMVLHANAFSASAEACYKEAMRLDPNDFQWPYLLGYLTQEKEDWPAAANWFEKALEAEPRYSGAHMRLGRTFLQMGKFDEAEREFRWILRVNPQSAAAHFGLGRIAAEQKDFATAASYFEKVRQRMPQATAVYYPLAMAYRQLGEREKAKEMLARRGKEDTPFFDPIVVELDSLNATVEEAMSRGLAAMNANQLDRAEVFLKRGVELEPENALARLNLGVLLLKKQQFDLAEREFSEVLRLKPDLVEAQTNLGVVWAMRGKDAEAIKAFEKALAMNPDFDGAKVLLGNALVRLKHFEKAQKIQAELMTEKPHDSRAFFYYGLILAELGHELEARRHFEESLTRFPQQAELVEALARLLASADSETVRDGARALELAEGLFLARQTPIHAQTLAMALAETGKFLEARQLIQQLLAQIPPRSAPGLVSDLTKQRDMYAGNRPCREPWTGWRDALSPGPP